MAAVARLVAPVAMTVMAVMMAVMTVEKGLVAEIAAREEVSVVMVGVEAAVAVAWLMD